MTMVLRTLGLFLILFSSTSFAQGRGPAVEDFVGIEVEEARLTTPQGTEPLYNLEQDLTRYEEKKKAPTAVNPNVKSASAAERQSTSTIFGISFVLGLPLIIWFLMMGHLKKKASLESASNIEVLEKYRKERERKIERDIRKVS